MEKRIQFGSVELKIDEETGEFTGSVISVESPYGILLTPNPIETATLLAVLRLTFDDGREYMSTHQILNKGAECGSGWSHLAQFQDRPEIFWICVGALSVYVPIKKMQEIYEDLLRAFSEFGTLPEFPKSQSLSQ
jgi:hypothetical protein